MGRFILRDVAFKIDRDFVRENNPPSVSLLGLDYAVWIRSPNGLPEGSPDASNARHHGDFDDDIPTVKATLARILGSTMAPPASLEFAASPSALAHRRRDVES